MAGNGKGNVYAQFLLLIWDRFLILLKHFILCLLDRQKQAILHSDHPPYHHCQALPVPYLKRIVLPGTVSLWLPRKHNKCHLEIMKDQAARRMEYWSPCCLILKPQKLTGVAVWL